MYVTLLSYVSEKQSKDKTRLPRVYWAVVVIFYAECVPTPLPGKIIRFLRILIQYDQSNAPYVRKWCCLN